MRLAGLKGPPAHRSQRHHQCADSRRDRDVPERVNQLGRMAVNPELDFITEDSLARYGESFGAGVLAGRCGLGGAGRLAPQRRLPARAD